MESNQFDRFLLDSLDQLPPEGLDSKAVTPWRKPVMQILWGMALTAFTLNLWNLRYVLPFLGLLLQYLGFRTLRRENRWFRAAHVLSVLRAAWSAAWLILLAPPLWGTVPDPWPAASNLAAQLAQLLLFRQALRTVYAKNQKKPPHDPLLWATLCLLVMAVCVVWQIDWLPLTVALIGLQILSLWLLSRVGRDLDQVGYTMQAAPVRWSGGAVLGVAGGLVLILTFGTLLWFSHRPPEAVEASQSDASALEMLVGEDAALLVDLPQTYLSLLEQAVSAQVTASFENGSLDGGPQVTAFHFQTEDRWVYTLYCFQWEHPCSWWGDTVYVHVTPYGQGDLVGGGLLWERDGKTWTAPISDLTYSSRREMDPMLGVMTTQNEIQGVVTFPFGSRAQRGYVLFKMQPNPWEINTPSLFAYTHRILPAYPYAQNPSGGRTYSTGRVDFYLEETPEP